MKVRTWAIELVVVGAVLAIVAYASGGRLLDWVSAAAVLASFAHGQVADRLAEAEGRRAAPIVGCHRWARFYFVTKEALWASYFLASGAYSALAGVALFLLYPAWRALYRRRAR